MKGSLVPDNKWPMNYSQKYGTERTGVVHSKTKYLYILIKQYCPGQLAKMI